MVTDWVDAMGHPRYHESGPHHVFKKNKQNDREVQKNPTKQQFIPLTFPFEKEETTCTCWVPGWAGIPLLWLTQSQSVPP